MSSPPESQRMERILALLRAQGGRLTATRRAIVTAIVGTRSHVTADELAEAVRVDHPDLHLTTVYRCLDTLERLGVVDHVHLGHGRAVYHLADEVHQHLVCEVCEAVVEVPSAVFEELAGQLRAAYGFAIRPHHFAVVGRCAACGEPEASIS